MIIFLAIHWGQYLFFTSFSFFAIWCINPSYIWLLTLCIVVIVGSESFMWTLLFHLVFAWGSHLWTSLSVTTQITGCFETYCLGLHKLILRVLLSWLAIASRIETLVPMHLLLLHTTAIEINHLLLVTAGLRSYSEAILLVLLRLVTPTNTIWCISTQL